MNEAALDTFEAMLAIRRILIRHSQWHDCTFYTQDEWQKRGEPYGRTAQFTLTFEGPFNLTVNLGPWSWADEFNQLLDDHGLWYELGFAWSMHFYSKEDL